MIMGKIEVLGSPTPLNVLKAYIPGIKLPTHSPS
jgi:hypothetical protein